MSSNQPKSPSKWRFVRLLGAVALFAGIYLAGRMSGLFDDLEPDALQAKMHAAGPLGFVLYLLAFCAGLLVGVPGMLFIAAGILAYGPVLGFAVVMAGGVLSVTVSFALVRLTGGSALTSIQRPFVQRALAQLARRPITTVFLLRLVFWLGPPLNYTLALTSLRTRHYVIGSLAGLAPVILVASLLFHWGLSG